MTVVMHLNVNGYPKKPYPSREAARKDLLRRHRWRKRDWPAMYRCDCCGGWFLTHGEKK